MINHDERKNMMALLATIIREARLVKEWLAEMDDKELKPTAKVGHKTSEVGQTA